VVKRDIEDQDHAVKKDAAGQDHVVQHLELITVAVPLQDSMVEIAEPHHHHTGVKCTTQALLHVLTIPRRDKRSRSPVKRRYPSTPVVIPNRSKQPDGSITGLSFIS